MQSCEALSTGWFWPCVLWHAVPGRVPSVLCAYGRAHPQVAMQHFIGACFDHVRISDSKSEQLQEIPVLSADR